LISVIATALEIHNCWHYRRCSTFTYPIITLQVLCNCSYYLRT